MVQTKRAKFYTCVVLVDPVPKEVARLHVASRHGVVHQLLLHIPVHVLEVGARDHSRGFHVFSLNLHLQMGGVRQVKSKTGDERC